MRKKSVLYYEIFMAALVIFSIAFAATDNEITDKLNVGIWIVFVLDYFVRFFHAKNKWVYIKKHPLELIAIIPLDAVLKVARIERLIRVLRMFAIVNRYLKPVYSFMKLNGLHKVLVSITFFTIIVSGLIMIVEPNINTYQDALWWSFVTATTVGYGDIVPVTSTGRIIAAMLMLFGIGTIGWFTSSVATYLIGRQRVSRDAEVVMHEIRQAKLSDEEIDEIIEVLEKRKGRADA